MDMQDPTLHADTIRMLVASMTKERTIQFSEIEAERLLNAIARTLLSVPTGISNKR